LDFAYFFCFIPHADRRAEVARHRQGLAIQNQSRDQQLQNLLTGAKLHECGTQYHVKILQGDDDAGLDYTIQLAPQTRSSSPSKTVAMLIFTVRGSCMIFAVKSNQIIG
jgi:hypothetical protein